MAIMCGADTPFIWCLPVPQDDMGLTWHESLWAACETAEREWVRVLTDRQGDCYREQFPRDGTTGAHMARNDPGLSNQDGFQEPRYRWP